MRFVEKRQTAGEVDAFGGTHEIVDGADGFRPDGGHLVVDAAPRFEMVRMEIHERRDIKPPEPVCQLADKWRMAAHGNLLQKGLGVPCLRRRLSASARSRGI